MSKKEQRLKHDINVATILTLVGIFILGIPLNIASLVLSIKVQNRTKNKTTHTQATIVLMLSIIQLLIDIVLLFSFIASL